MGKQKAIVPEELAVTAAKAAVAEPADRSAAAFPPPRSAGLGICCTKRLLSQLDIGGAGDAGTTAWVDSMQASSPTHVKAAAALSASFAASHEEEYDNWLKQHPSALRDFDDIVAASKGKRVVMFLDYDGTLSPIVDDPDVAFMSDAMRKAVRDIARIFPTAIVSGRCREKVFDFVRLSELYYAGSHGLDIQGPTTRTKHTKTNAKAVSLQPASEFLPMVDEVYKALAEKTKDIKEARVENNTFSLSVHFRCVNEDEYCLLAEVVWSVLKGYPKLRLTFGRKVLEIRPSIEWDKGKALEFLLESLGFANCNNVFPVYIGDDRTDEDAFKVLHDRKQGLGILVSKFAKETNASYSLQEPAEVKEFLRRLVEWKRLPFKKRCKGIIN